MSRFISIYIIFYRIYLVKTDLRRPDNRLLYLREGTRQAEMLAFPFAAAREHEKLAESVSHGLRESIRKAEMQDSLDMKICTSYNQNIEILLK